jgi:uncharacterized protein YndB with AHSA1/START domain
VAEKSRAIAAPGEPTIVITRTVDAPRELVWKAWTDPKHIAHWWGPNGFTNTINSMVVKPGGEWRFIMHGPGGANYPTRVVYREVVKPERLVYDLSGDGETDPHTFRATVTFAEHEGKTQITMASRFPSVAARDAVLKFGAVEGGAQTLDRLADYLPTI